MFLDPIKSKENKNNYFILQVVIPIPEKNDKQDKIITSKRLAVRSKEKVYNYSKIIASTARVSFFLNRR